MCDVDLSLQKGSFTVITGRVGSGKSTLLRVLLGSLPLQAGELRWNGWKVEDASEVLTDIPPPCGVSFSSTSTFMPALNSLSG